MRSENGIIRRLINLLSFSLHSSHSCPPLKPVKNHAPSTNLFPRLSINWFLETKKGGGEIKRNAFLRHRFFDYSGISVEDWGGEGRITQRCVPRLLR